MIGVIAGVFVGVFLLIHNVVHHRRPIPTPTTAAEVQAAGVAVAGETPTEMTPAYKELKARMP